MNASTSLRWQWPAAACVIGGVAAVWTSAALTARQTGPWQAGLWLGGAIALAGLAWFFRQVTQAERDLEALRRDVTERERALASETQAWEAARTAIENQLAQQTKQLQAREAGLSARLLAFHEWMEFPQPIDLSAETPAAETAPGASAVPASPGAAVGDFVRKDRELAALLEAETQRVFGDILANKYVVDGKFQLQLARDEALDLVRRVARIYRPEVTEPLLETSAAQVLRGASRASLQLLVLVEQLPLNLKDKSFSEIYGYIRQGVKAYGYYKSAEPYWPIVSSAYYVGRFALGANPLVLAAWWFVGAWGQEGAKQLATKIMHRQALALLQNLIQVLGHEAANLYGGDFRHRDPNWLYAVELAELVHAFPLSRESLAQALKEIGGLQLRHEYDRVYLYRCLAAHASPEPARYRASECLAAAERQAIARRLERFLEAFIHGQTRERVARWRSAVEARLDFKLNVLGHGEERSHAVQLAEAVRSLASFLVAVKEREPDELPQLLADCALVRDTPAAERERLFGELLANPPYYFEQPALDPAAPLVVPYLGDLALLAARTTPHAVAIDDLLLDTAAYLRFDAKTMRKRLDEAYVAALSERVAADAPEKKFAAPVARAVLDVLAPGETARFIYGDVRLHWPANTATSSSKTAHWLVGVAQRLVLFVMEPTGPRLLWRGTPHNVTPERIRGYLAGEMKLAGGEWLGEDAAPPTFTLTCPWLARSEPYFQPLIRLLSETTVRPSA